MSLSGIVQTVLGLINPEELGITLPHEHLHIQFDVAYVPCENKDAHMTEAPFVIENLGWIRQNPFSHRPNLRLDDQESLAAVLDDVVTYKKNGGGTIVENTITGITRNIKVLKSLSEKSGVKIVSGTGYYVAASHSSNTLLTKEEEVSEIMVKELTEGCEDTSIKCGIVGEIGCSWPLHSFEKTVLRAAATVQAEMGSPVMIHPGRNNRAPHETLRVFQEAGGDASRTVMAHLDRTIFDNSELLEFAELGSYCEFDMFGIETSHYQMNTAVDMPSDAVRIQNICKLVDDGRADQVLVSHDMYSKHRLQKYGGHGYSHILVNVVPKMLQRGLTQDVVVKILVSNPRRWLTFK